MARTKKRNQQSVAKKKAKAKAQKKVAGAGGFGGKTPDRTPRKKKTRTT